MKHFPSRYKWLAKEKAPKMLVEALRHFGTLEHRGAGNNPDITKWATELGEDISKVYVADSIPWCGLFIGICAKRSGYEVVKDPLWALNWRAFGKNQEVAMLGDVMVLHRNTAKGKRAGHVALYVGEDQTTWHLLGGNQNNAVCISRFDKKRLYAIRRPAWKIGQPANVRRIVLKSSSPLSTNEQ